jgi:hypothetical protein
MRANPTHSNPRRIAQVLAIIGVCSVYFPAQSPMFGCLDSIFPPTKDTSWGIAQAQSGGDFSPPPDPRKNKKKPQPTPAADPAPAPTNPDDPAEEGRKVFSNPGTPGTSPDTPSRPGETGWAIVLETFKGANAVGQAQQRLPEVSTLLKRSDLTIRVRETGCALVLGSYPSADSDAAQRDLKAVRATEITAPGGFKARPYEKAFLAAPSVSDRGQLPEFDLQTLRRRLGTQTAYTVQIGVYETPDKPEEAKRAAEKAAKVLRDAGEKAFYYHGPRRSVVTIGVFTTRDIDQNTNRPRNPEIARIRKDYPLNLLNGQYPIVVGRTAAGTPAHQVSEVMKVP